MAPTSHEDPSHDNAAALLALTLTRGVGRKTIHRLDAVRVHLGVSWRRFLSIPPGEAAAAFPVGAQALAAWLVRCGEAERSEAKAMLAAVCRAGAHVLLMSDLAYPERLKSALGQAAPPFLCVRGDVGRLQRLGAAVVGRRHPQPRSARLARQAATLLVNAGWDVVSGGADGIDSTAHRAAVDAGGGTLVILPQGILTYRVADYLAAALAEGRAAVVSEWPPACPWETHAAVARNATISGLAERVVVIEPRKTGGSMRTARWALEQRKRVFVFGPSVRADHRATGVGPLLLAGALPLLGRDGVINIRQLLDRNPQHNSHFAAQPSLWIEEPDPA